MSIEITVVVAAYLAVSLLAAMLVPLVIAAGAQPNARLTLPVWLGVALAVCYGLIATIGAANGFRTGASAFSYLIPALLAPLLIGFGAIWLVQPLRHVLGTPRLQPMLISVQAYRVVGLGFLVLVALGRLPAIFGVPAGLSALHFIPATPTSLVLSLWPLVIVPPFIVPLDIWLHVVSLRFLLAHRTASAAAMPAPRLVAS